MYAGGGKIIDWLGAKRGFIVMMLFWSFACASHGFATGFAMLAVSRFLLGVGEGGGFPAVTKSIAEWFPARERSTAMGIVNAGSAVGSLIAPPAIAAIISTSNWRWVFWACGSVGVLWTFWWWRTYFAPSEHPRLTETERDEIGEVIQTDEQRKAPISWIKLFAYPQVWGLVSAKFLSDAGWYFYLFWLPKYLYDVRGFDTKQVGYYAWIPYAAAGVGSLMGGWFSSHLLKRGKSLNLSRKLALGLSATLMPFIIIVTHTPVEWAIVLFSMAFFGHQSWATIIMILPTDIFPRSLVGSVAGLIGFGGAMGGVIFNLFAGRVLDAGFGYGVVFAFVGSFHVISYLIILVTVRNVDPIRFAKKL